jgi:hypothetical protein
MTLPAELQRLVLGHVLAMVPLAISRAARVCATWFNLTDSLMPVRGSSLFGRCYCHIT